MLWSVKQHERMIRDRTELIAHALGHAPTTILDIDNGYDFHVAIVDEEWAFRFPRRAGVEEALAQLLTGTSASGERAVDEVRTQFAKTRHHQQSMLVALREALTAMLATTVPTSGVDVVMGIGGSAEGVLAAAALACVGGDIQARFHARDAADAQTNPFEPAPGADVLDTASLSIEETLLKALERVRERAPWLVNEERA